MTSNAIFSDETTVQIDTHRRFCCTKSGLKPRYKPRPKHPTKVHVWAAISKKGRSGICIFEGCMDAVAYTGILERALLPMIEKLSKWAQIYSGQRLKAYICLGSTVFYRSWSELVAYQSPQIVTQSKTCGMN